MYGVTRFLCAWKTPSHFFLSDDWWWGDEIRRTRCCQKVCNFNLTATATTITTIPKRNLVSRRQINERDYERDSVYSLCLQLLIRMTMSAIWVCVFEILVGSFSSCFLLQRVRHAHTPTSTNFAIEDWLAPMLNKYLAHHFTHFPYHLYHLLLAVLASCVYTWLTLNVYFICK